MNSLCKALMTEKGRLPHRHRVWLLCVPAALGIVLAAGLAFDAYRLLTTPSTIDASALVTIPRGISCAGVAQLLAEHDVFRTERGPWYWRIYGRLSGQCGHLKRGTYRLQPGQTPLAMLNMFAAGDIATATLTIIPGRRFKQLMARIKNSPALKYTLADKTPAEIMAAIGHPKKMPEGMFMPETYRFPLGTTDREFLKRAYQAMQAFLAKAWENRAENAVVDTPYQALILASIVEKETALPAERGRISGVFSRRLQQGMLLQADPTVIYGLSSFGHELTHEGLTIDTPYNTYMHPGLPPTPIAMPSRASIRAALHPTPGDAMYFVATGKGGHEFSETLAQQRAAIEKYY